MRNGLPFLVSCSIEGQRKAFWSEHEATINDLQRLVMEQVHVWEPLHHLAQDGLHLQTCQWCADAEVNTVADWASSALSGPTTCGSSEPISTGMLARTA
jgi:hypothetical protein